MIESDQKELDCIKVHYWEV